MKTSLKFLMMLLALGFVVTNVAFAETFQGQITSMGPDGRSFSMNQMDQDAGTSQPKTVRLKEDAEFKGGINSLNELSVGDNVKVDAEDKGGILEASSIELDEEAQGADAGATSGTDTNTAGAGAQSDMGATQGSY